MSLELEEVEIDEEACQCSDCEICGMPTEFIMFACRDEVTLQLAEIYCCCQKCHDEWCLCNCPKNIKGEKGES